VFGGTQTAVRVLDSKSREIVTKNLNIYFNKYDSTAYNRGREFWSPCREECNYTTWEVYEKYEGVREISRVSFTDSFFQLSPTALKAA